MEIQNGDVQVFFQVYCSTLVGLACEPDRSGCVWRQYLPDWIRQLRRQLRDGVQVRCSDRHARDPVGNQDGQ